MLKVLDAMVIPGFLAFGLIATSCLFVTHNPQFNWFLELLAFCSFGLAACAILGRRRKK